MKDVPEKEIEEEEEAPKEEESEEPGKKPADEEETQPMAEEHEDGEKKLEEHSVEEADKRSEDKEPSEKQGPKKDQQQAKLPPAAAVATHLPKDPKPDELDEAVLSMLIDAKLPHEERKEALRKLVEEQRQIASAMRQAQGKGSSSAGAASSSSSKPKPTKTPERKKSDPMPAAEHVPDPKDESSLVLADYLAHEHNQWQIDSEQVVPYQ